MSDFIQLRVLQLVIFFMDVVGDQKPLRSLHGCGSGTPLYDFVFNLMGHFSDGSLRPFFGPPPPIQTSPQRNNLPPPLGRGA